MSIAVVTPPTARHLHGGVDCKSLDQLPLSGIDIVTFYKRDELTTDLICCDVAIADDVWTFHEEMVGWDLLIDHLSKLPDFQADWYAAVSRPVFAASETIAFER